MRCLYEYNDIIIYLLIIFILLIIIIQVYYDVNKKFKEGLKIRNISKNLSKDIKKTTSAIQQTGKQVEQTGKQVTQQATKQVEQTSETAIKEVKKIASQLNIQNILGKLIDPITSLKNNLSNTFKFLEQF